MSKDENRTPLVIRYVYAILAIIALAVATVLLSLFAAQQHEREARDRIQFLHLAVVAESTELAREARTLRQRVLDQLGPGERQPTGVARVQNVQIGYSGILQSMRSRLLELSILEENSDDEIFALAFKRLADKLNEIDGRLRLSKPTPESITSIEVMVYTIEQYQRLHQIAAENELFELADRQRRRPRFLAFLMLCLSFGAVTSWYLVRSLKDSLRRQATTELALVESQERMHHLQKLDALGRLVGGIAHDFNNWLTVILGHSSLLHDEAGENERLKAGLDEIQQASLQAASLTRQLLAFSRRQPFEARVVNLNVLIQDMEEMLQRVIGAGIRLTFTYEDDLRDVEVDPDQMQQVILNLINNARDAMPDGGRISIATENIAVGHAGLEIDGVPSGEYARLSVSDTGVGMDIATRQRIFEPFFTTKDKGQGTGLGLSTVHGIVTGFNGHVFVESLEGVGSSFNIYLPHAQHRQVEVSDVLQTVDSPSGIETVLVVEDNEQVREFVETGLTTLGYRVLSASGGAGGLEICRIDEIEIDVILSDVVMPGTSGPKFMAAALKLRPDAIAIYMSAYTRDEVLAFRHSNNETDIPLISKPFEIEALSRMIRQQLDSKKNA